MFPLTLLQKLSPNLYNFALTYLQELHIYFRLGLSKISLNLQ